MDAEAEVPILRSPDMKASSLEKTLILAKGSERRGQQRMRWLAGTNDWMNMSLNNFRELVMDRGDWHAAVHSIAEIRI